MYIILELINSYGLKHNAKCVLTIYSDGSGNISDEAGDLIFSFSLFEELIAEIS
jgi:hypothetical protein